MRVQSREPRSQHHKYDTLPGPGHAQGPVRTCVGCRATGVRTDLVRLVIDTSDHDDVAAEPQPRVIVDERKDLPGRGAWLHPESRCWRLAERRRAVHRALRGGRHLDVASVATWFEKFDGQHLQVLGE